MPNQPTSNLLWFAAGVSIGAVVGIIVAPASGEDTRRALTDAAADSGREYLERGRELYEMGRQLAEETAGLFDEGRKMMDSEA